MLLESFAHPPERTFVRKAITSTGGTINNSYDAFGRKRTSSTAAVTTTYFGEIEYEGNAMKAIYHEDGRIEKLGGGTFEYQYYIKDHFG